MRIPKRLFQKNLTTKAENLYKTPASKRTQVVEIWIANTNSTETRAISLYAHGLADSNVLLKELELQPNATKIISESKIILDSLDVLGAKQLEGVDVIVTAYGIEEDI